MLREGLYCRRLFFLELVEQHIRGSLMMYITFPAFYRIYYL